MKSEKIYFLYQDVIRTEEAEQIIYVGIGHLSRIEGQFRNNEHKSIVSKNLDAFQRRVLLMTNSPSLAKDLEKKTIEREKQNGSKLLNKTKGGELWHSEEPEQIFFQVLNQDEQDLIAYNLSVLFKQQQAIRRLPKIETRNWVKQMKEAKNA